MNCSERFELDVSFVRLLLLNRFDNLTRCRYLLVVNYYDYRSSVEMLAIRLNNTRATKLIN